MLQIIFEDVNGQPKPRLPRAGDGTVRVPDGARYLSVEQAATTFGMTAAQLEQMYRDWFGELLPGDGASDRPPKDEEPRVVRAKLDLLHAFAHPDLDDEEFAYFLEAHEARGLSPWMRHLWPRRRHDATTDKPVLEFIATIDTFRLIADRSGQYDGQTPPVWCGRDGVWRDVWACDEPPYACQLGVVRKGIGNPFYGIAYWDFYAQAVEGPRGQRVLSECWLRGGPNQLAKCAEALAFRKGFPERFSGLYTRDEMMQTDGPRPAASGPRRPAPPAGDDDAAALDEGPQTNFQFELALVDVGFGNPVKRAEVINHFKQTFRETYTTNKPAFYAKVLREIRKRPRAYGVEVELAALV